MSTVDLRSPQTATAEEVLGGTLPMEAVAIVALARTLAQQGDRDTARRLHARRAQIDREGAYGILSGGRVSPADGVKLAVRLAGDKEFGLARRILKVVRPNLKRGDEVYRKAYQKSTLYTYKDPDLPLDWRLDRALGILEEAEDLSTTTNPESLGLAGAICKRKWEVDSAPQHLDRALFFYLRGYSAGAPEEVRDPIEYLRAHPQCVFDAGKDQGYTGINAAFILDLQASQEADEATRAGMQSRAAMARRESARLIREEIIRSVPRLGDDPAFAWLASEWWYYATIGEAYFGLGSYNPACYEKAVEWLVERPAEAGLVRRPAGADAGPLDIPEWEFESTARQLARVAILHAPAGISEANFEKSAAGLALARILENDRQAVRSAFRGKFGLALSGGGFRASLFHIGVLACLAERDALRHVEVLSCVSGGSIIGAHYYLELRHLLQTKTDSEIRPKDYVEIVERIEQQFLRGVQRNLRMRVLAELTTNLKLIFRAGYSRTMRLGDLYERELFSRVADGHEQGSQWLPDWLAELLKMRRYRWLNELFIHPVNALGEPQKDFSPRNHNWRRQHKVPGLVLNATSLNTGHCWQFTASFMGEPPTPINAEIDANERLRRMYYRHAPAAHRTVRLGHAVAASSCVPGLFEPIILEGLYPERSVRLVDGGVCDNQGISSLLEQDCTVLLVSDASGQMDSEKVPSSGVVGVPLRANSILQTRVRETQYSGAAARKRSQLLRGLMFLHLKQDLSAEAVPWVDCPSHLKVSDFAPVRDAGHDATSFGIATSVQRQLSAIRTDLDSFHDIEAYALMTSGYRMAEAQLEGQTPCVAGFTEKVALGKWNFLKVEHALRPEAVSGESTSEKSRRYVTRLLGTAASLAFKVWQLSPVLGVIRWLLAAAVAAGAAWLFYSRWERPFLPPQVAATTFANVASFLLMTAAAAVLAFVLNRIFGRRLGSGVMKTIRWRDTLRSVVIGICMAAGGFIVARLHLHIFDKWYLHYGQLDRLDPPRR